jgi:hypothetical protein
MAGQELIEKAKQILSSKCDMAALTQKATRTRMAALGHILGADFLETLEEIAMDRFEQTRCDVGQCRELCDAMARRFDQDMEGMRQQLDDLRGAWHSLQAQGDPQEEPQGLDGLGDPRREFRRGAVRRRPYQWKGRPLIPDLGRVNAVPLSQSTSAVASAEAS